MPGFFVFGLVDKRELVVVVLFVVDCDFRLAVDGGVVAVLACESDSFVKCKAAVGDDLVDGFVGVGVDDFHFLLSFLFEVLASFIVYIISYYAEYVNSFSKVFEKIFKKAVSSARLLFYPFPLFFVA